MTKPLLSSQKTPRPPARRPGKPAEEETPAPRPVHLAFPRPRGMHDVLPASRPAWDLLEETVRGLATSFHYRRIEPTILEAPGLFDRSLGVQSDIIAKELFLARDRSGKEKLALRPEYTAGVVRAYLEHGLASEAQPVRLWYIGPVFRHDRPQAGRYRQFWQFGVEAIGEDSPVIDAQVIHLAYEIYHQLQLEELRLEVNSLGHLGPSCRPDFLARLKAHASDHLPKLCRDCKARLRRSPLRILDCKEEKCQVVANTAPKLTEHLCGACGTHYAEVLRLLRELQIPVRENPRLVRGLDYYTRTVFEIFPAGGTRGVSGLGSAATGSGTGEDVARLALCSGGRYDGLAELLGGPPTPAVGWSAGVERTLLAMGREGITVRTAWKPEVFLVHLGDLGRKRSLQLFDELRRAGFRVAEAFHKPGMKAQLRVADRLRIPWVLILGQKEALDGTVILRNMDSGTQETLELNLDVLSPALRKRLHRNGP